MGKIAFVFSGQGAQHPGMAKAFYESNANVKALFDAAEQIRPGTLAQCFEGDAETLKQTQNTQPCLYLTDLAAAIALKDAGITPDAVAGFSLGELPALCFAGAFSAEDGFRLVCKRGEYMANSSADASMAAVVKLSDDVVEDLCKSFAHIYPVNYNSPGQLVVAGATDELPAFSQKVKEAGGRTIPLKVSGAFHSPYMDAAAAQFAKTLDGFQMENPQIPAYANFTAQPYGNDVKSVLKEQMNHPVRWTDTVLHMADSGIDTFIECGVGSTLQKLIQKIAPEKQAFAVEDPESLQKVKEALSC